MKFLFIVLLLAAPTVHAAGPIVQTQSGAVQGTDLDQVESFKGIPFAAPPLGALRWQPPVEPAAWAGVRDAAEYSSECTQPLGNQIVGSEDCLYLNVWKPKQAAGLPVMVFIPGGAHIVGSASDSVFGVAVYDGKNLAQNGNVVVVTLNYRLGALGFLAHHQLSAKSGYGGSGNYGYMDQIQALEWLKKNISSFGGDPKNITLFGQSAGGWSVAVLLASPLAKGLFHKGIIHSGGTMSWTLSDEEKNGTILSANLKCSAEVDELACLRGKTASDVVAALPGMNPSLAVPYGPTVDGHVLPDFPLSILQKGQHNHMPLLIGTTGEEMVLMGYEASKNIHTERDYVDAVTAVAGPWAPKLLSLYPVQTYASPRQAYNDISADNVFVCPARKIARAVEASQTEFVGRFHYTHTLSSGPFVPWGPAHAFELFFLFGNFGAAKVVPTEAEQSLAIEFQQRWSTFARTGVPGSDSLWERYGSKADNYVIFGDAVSKAGGLHTTQCDFWDFFGI